jgi:hypothetical protein
MKKIACRINSTQRKKHVELILLEEKTVVKLTVCKIKITQIQYYMAVKIGTTLKLILAATVLSKNA